MALYRVRQGFVKARTAQPNQIRGSSASSVSSFLKHRLPRLAGFWG